MGGALQSRWVRFRGWWNGLSAASVGLLIVVGGSFVFGYFSGAFEVPASIRGINEQLAAHTTILSGTARTTDLDPIRARLDLTATSDELAAVGRYTRQIELAIGELHRTPSEQAILYRRLVAQAPARGLGFRVDGQAYDGDGVRVALLTRSELYLWNVKGRANLEPDDGELPMDPVVLASTVLRAAWTNTVVEAKPLEPLMAFDDLSIPDFIEPTDSFFVHGDATECWRRFEAAFGQPAETIAWDGLISPTTTAMEYLALATKHEAAIRGIDPQ